MLICVTAVEVCLDPDFYRAGATKADSSNAAELIKIFFTSL
jgi:hypothetical protein